VTLADLLPSMGRCVEPPLAGGIWPVGTRGGESGDLLLGGVPATHLAARFGTPVTALAETDVRRRASAFAAALPEAEIVFAGKALAYGVGRIVVDSTDEIDHIAALARPGQAVLVRVTPGVDAHTHRAVTTGTDDQKFGFPLAGGKAAAAVANVLATPGPRLVGLHCHIGSQVWDVAGYEEAVRRMIGLAALVRDRHGVAIGQLDVGGGFAVPYRAGDPEFDLTGFAHRVRVALRYECDAAKLPVPDLVIEPGRSLVATAGVTLYRVITVKHGTHRTFVAVDGGMSDNPRPALYGARYTVRLVSRHSTAPTTPVTVVGRHCEAGDVVAEDVPLAADVRSGDLLAVAGTGAYHHALASNYNMVPRPPLVRVADGEATLLVRRETEEDLLARDLG
jgi:diaminopimelate decarboxylase